MQKKSIAGGVLGIVGAVFAIIGGIGFAMCADIVDGLTGSSYTWAAYVFGLGGGVVGLVGGILDFFKPTVGGILQILSVVMAIVVCVLMFWQWAMIIAMILLAIGAILSFVLQKEATPKSNIGNQNTQGKE